ncbi:hypothetical protein JL36_08490 [Lactococcus cremoris]|nr:hypothetical protein JL36_08490 [Lactococcus cremoris]
MKTVADYECVILMKFPKTLEIVLNLGGRFPRISGFISKIKLPPDYLIKVKDNFLPFFYFIQQNSFE